jgi:hypothetical protein
MDLARRAPSRDLKIAAMREIDGGRSIGQVARQLELRPPCWNDGAASGGRGVSWHFQALEAAGTTSPGSAGTTAEASHTGSEGIQ